MKKMALIMAMAMLVCWLPGQVLADTLIDWELNGVTFQGGGTATGDFVYDATNNTIKSWDITASQGTSVLSGTADPHTFSASTSVSVSNALPGGQITFWDPTAGNWPVYDLQLFTSGAFSALAAPGSLTLKNTSYYQVYASSSSNKSDLLTSGTLTGTAVPLPPSAFLLGSGLLGLAGLRRFRKG